MGDASKYSGGKYFFNFFTKREEEKIEVSDEEINTEIENMLKGATEKKEELGKFLNTPQARESIKQTLITRKAVQRLVDIAKAPKKTKRIQKGEEK